MRITMEVSQLSDHVKKMQLVLFWIPLICMSTYTTAKLPRKVRCRLPLPFASKCLGKYFLCPLDCPRTCLMDCNLCKPVCGCNFPGAVCQDPRFVGGDGITFYFHGHKDQDFCIVSDTNLHINAHFIGKRNPNLKRDFTWVQSIGLLFDNHKLLVSAQKTSTWDDNTDRLALSFDENPIFLPTKAGSKWDSHTAPQVAIYRTSRTNSVVIEVADNFRVTTNVVPITAQESRVHGYDIRDDDCFTHLEVAFKFYNLSDAVDGVLGQTYRSNYKSKIKANVIMPIMGGAYKYRTSGIFATNCLVSRFGKFSNIHRETAVPQQIGLEGFKCTSGMQGKGLVCKH
ncbi:hypothetical protein BUALT_Bualt01G0117700 [Buddleja alternifolia]|uniref:Root cap n=1 Tax=Buddleja alternifolia TaxID=168488 RepID=A0AAV6YEY8_9LAMI|nr:hypothetical protein BUALT_Bualt01G0117700 [Buddleja alternifolia]